MIKDYNIKLVNKEEILYVYLDFNSEFVNLNSNNLIEKVKDYLERNIIDFKGDVVAIVINGIMIGTLFLYKTIETRIYSSLSNNKYNIVSIIDNIDDSITFDNIKNMYVLL